ncbi:hypothetical protein EDD95_2378 [Streptomyces sp. CEV 2-1]|nr:hypothetical protein EDD95_2378 [Streptomyces sp. CEV 2-1]
MAVRLECIGEDRVDFEPYESFLTADETTDWFRAWTGNAELNGDDFRVFGQDGTGGYAAFWLVRPGRELGRVSGRDQSVGFVLVERVDRVVRCV